MTEHTPTRLSFLFDYGHVALSREGIPMAITTEYASIFLPKPINKEQTPDSALLNKYERYVAFQRRWAELAPSDSPPPIMTLPEYAAYARHVTMPLQVMRTAWENTLGKDPGLIAQTSRDRFGQLAERVLLMRYQLFQSSE